MNNPGYDTPLPNPNWGPNLFPSPYNPAPAPSFCPIPEPYRGPGALPIRHPAPGEECYVLEELRTEEGALYEVVIRGGKVYSVTVEADDEEETGRFECVQWWEHGADECGQYEHAALNDAFFWFDDALREARFRLTKAEEDAENG